MNSTLTVFTAITDSYRYSMELSQSFEMLRDLLPGAHWVVHEPDSASTQRELAESLPRNGLLLFVREPALLVGPGAIPELRRILEGDAACLAVLPSDIRGYHPGQQAAYYTLRGFERFVAGLAGHGGQTLPCDGRSPWMFLMRGADLNGRKLPDDPFDLPLELPEERVAISSAAYIHPFLNYYSETRSDLLPHVPEGITSLLDIGCSRGGFGAAVKSARGCRVAGIEMNRHEARSAEKLLDRVWVGDMLALDIDEKFDCITCLDVLEHIPEPRQLLEKAGSLLNPGGKLLLSVPNVGHWAVVEDLLAGRWDYIPAGILCTTHVRFYTRHSLVHLLEQCGFSVASVDAQRTPPPDELRQGLSAYGGAGMELDEESLATLLFIALAERP
ncbi:MAG: class I SAM-dependent methyltransferase [Desulfuromonadales bacterium]